MFRRWLSVSVLLLSFFVFKAPQAQSQSSPTLLQLREVLEVWAGDRSMIELARSANPMLWLAPTSRYCFTHEQFHLLVALAVAEPDVGLRALLEMERRLMNQQIYRFEINDKFTPDVVHTILLRAEIRHRLLAI